MIVQAGMATDKAYSRKLEAKLSASKSISDLHARCSQYKLKLRELAQELQEAESRTESVQGMADVRADEVRLCTQPCCRSFVLIVKCAHQTRADVFAHKILKCLLDATSAYIPKHIPSDIKMPLFGSRVVIRLQCWDAYLHYVQCP